MDNACGEDLSLPSPIIGVGVAQQGTSTSVECVFQSVFPLLFFKILCTLLIVREKATFMLKIYGTFLVRHSQLRA